MMFEIDLQKFGGRGAKYDTARGIVDQYDLEMITDSKDKIVDFYSAMDKSNGIRIDLESWKIRVSKDADAKVGQLADELVDRMVERNPGAEADYKAIREALDGTYTISEYDRHDIPDYRRYIRSSENFIKIGRTGTSIDSKYEELASMFPGYFDAQAHTSPSDRLMDINNVLSGLKDSISSGMNLSDEERSEAARYLKNDIIKGYAYVLNQRRRKPA